MSEKFTHFNDLARQKCRILRREPQQDLIDKGVKPFCDWVVVENEDGSQEKLFPWEITMIHKTEWEKL